MDFQNISALYIPVTNRRKYNRRNVVSSKEKEWNDYRLKCSKTFDCLDCIRYMNIKLATTVCNFFFSYLFALLNCTEINLKYTAHSCK